MSKANRGTTKITQSRRTRRIVFPCSTALTTIGTSMAAAPALASTRPDAELLAACEAFEAAYQAVIVPHITDDEAGDRSDDFYAALARVEALHATTPEEIRAKARAAHRALMYEAAPMSRVDWRAQASAEQRVAIDTLRVVFESAAA